MATLSRVILFYGIVMIQIFKTTSDNVKIPTLPSMIATEAHAGNGIMGVASIAEVTSNNGKISSTGGVKFIPPVGTKLKKNSNYMQPWTFSRKTRDGFVMGAIHAYPGTLMASAASYGNSKNDFEQINPVTSWPVPNNFYPLPTYSSRTHRNPFFPNYMFKDFDPLIPSFGDAWFRPFYDPFFDIWH